MLKRSHFTSFSAKGTLWHLPAPAQRLDGKEAGGKAASAQPPVGRRAPSVIKEDANMELIQDLCFLTRFPSLQGGGWAGCFMKRESPVGVKTPKGEIFF